MSSQKLFFPNAAGNQLAAVLETPASGRPSAYAIFAHCFTCSKDYKAVTHISRRLTEDGISTLRFDFSGLGESEGNFSDSNFSGNLRDILAAATFLSQSYQAPQVLLGHSLGGTAMLRAAQDLSSVKAVITLASPCQPAHLLGHLEQQQEVAETEGEVEAMISGRPFLLKKHFFDDLRQHDMVSVLRNFDKALLILHSPSDSVIDIAEAAKIFQAVRRPKSFVALHDADHLLTDRRDALYAAGVISAWLKKYLP